MSRYSFSNAEREGIWTAFDEKCWLCKRPVGFKDMEVDHVMPVNLSKKPNELAKIIKEQNLPRDFEIESFENWRPSCANCNRQKSGIPHTAPIIIIEITGNKTKVQKAKQIAKTVVSDARLGKALACILEAAESARLDCQTINALKDVVPTYHQHHEEVRTVELYGQDIDMGNGVIISNGRLTVVRQPFGFGTGNPDAHSSIRCGICGNAYFNGARCTLCGVMDED